MNASKRISGLRRHFGCGSAARRAIANAVMVALVLVAKSASSRAGEKPAVSLDDYLGRLRYFGLELKVTEKNQSLLNGELAGKKRVFLVDTGWRITTLDEHVAAGLNTLGQLGVVLDDRLFGRLTNSEIVLMDKLTLGRAQFLNQPARVEKLKMDGVHVPFDGVLGSDFFFRNFCLLDCYARRLYVRSARATKEESQALEATLRQSGFSEIPLHSEQPVCVQANANGEVCHLLLDTGAAFSILDESQVKRLGLTAIQRDSAETGTLLRDDLSGQIVGMGKIGTHKVRVVTVHTLEIGPRKWSNVHFGLANLRDWGLAKSGTPLEDVEGLLGPELLARDGVVIDFSNNKVWLRPER